MYSYKKAFTLVELMIVIAILGILMAALVPSLSTYMARGRNVGRATDVKNINIALKNYYYDFGKTPYTQSGTEAAICMGMTDTEMCWREYTYNPDVATIKGRDKGIYGRTSFITVMNQYLGRIPTDPLIDRPIGDRYIFSTAAGDVYCAGSQTVWAGGWIIWQPEKISPTTDAECMNRGQWGCCSGIGCGLTRSCLDRVDM